MSIYWISDTWFHFFLLKQHNVLCIFIISLNQVCFGIPTPLLLKDPNLKSEMIELLEEKLGNEREGIGLHKNMLNGTLTARELASRVPKWGREAVSRANRQP